MTKPIANSKKSTLFKQEKAQANQYAWFCQTFPVDGKTEISYFVQSRFYPSKYALKILKRKN